MYYIKKNRTHITTLLLLIAAVIISGCTSGSGSTMSSGLITPANGKLEIPVAGINDGKSHHFQVQANDGTIVTFFVLKSADGVIRAAIDACDVCYRSGLGYYQEGDSMVCKNCGQKFASNKINIIKGGCNPAPLNRTLVGDKLVIQMKDINMNSWYMKYRQS
ncbi:Fe-S-containing protein [Thermodesulfobacteriota bacterium]